MAELADATDLKSVGGDTLWVRLPLALQIWPECRIYGHEPKFRGHSAQKGLCRYVFKHRNLFTS